MISLGRWRCTVFICVLAIMVGVLHGMTHIEFYNRYSQFFDDIDKLCELFVKYIYHIFEKMGQDIKSNDLKSVTDHYNQMVNRAQPLFQLFARDTEKLRTFLDNLESINMVKKFLYSYFRQSAINLIDHLKLVYNLD